MKHTWPDGASLRVRMGLHTGEPVTETGGYVGLDVHRAARICSAGHGGQILLSDAVRVLAARDLPPGVSLRDLGAHRLKDLREPEHLFQVAHPDLPADFPPLKSLDVLPNNLPRQLTSFIGREKEMADVTRQLSAASLVTLTGSGGAGKTRLALQVAAEAVEDYPDGVWLAEFAPIADPTLVPKTVASALRVPEQPGRDLTETLIDALRPKAVLLVLDNCEHLLAACADLAAALLRACPQVRILATSREALGVPGEILWRIPSLSVPDIRRLPASEDLVLYEAVRLFVDRAVAITPGFTVTNENAPAVAQVCQRLDGIPLAIELAAARVKVLAVEQIAARLDDRFRLLTGGGRMVLPRHQTLRAAIDWSYHLLSETERVLLRRLSVFAGGWTLDAAESVCAGGSVDAANILDLLTSLVDKSLVLAEMQRGEARYWLLETVRQYARDRLVEAGEEAEVRTRHRAWYLTLAEHAEVELRGPRQRIWFERLEVEHDNLRTALAWSREDRGSAGALLRLVGALTWYWWSRGNWREARGWSEEAVNRRGDAPRAVLPVAYASATHYAWRFGDNQRAKMLGEEGLTIARDLGDKRNSALLLAQLGVVALRQMAHGEAVERFEEAVRLARETGDKWLLSLCLSDLGRAQGDLGLAAALHEEALTLVREVGDTAMVSYTLRCLGIVRLRQGDYQRAEEFFTDSLRLSSETRFPWITFECLVGLAGVSSANGQHDRAARLFGAAAALGEVIGHIPLPQDQADHDRRLASARIGLGEAPFAEGWAEGRAMTLEQAIEYALAAETG
jgi:predicted ATPase